MEKCICQNINEGPRNDNIQLVMAPITHTLSLSLFLFLTLPQVLLWQPRTATNSSTEELSTTSRQKSSALVGKEINQLAHNVRLAIIIEPAGLLCPLNHSCPVSLSLSSLVGISIWTTIICPTCVTKEKRKEIYLAAMY